MTLYRKTVWFAKGLWEYTKGGFLSAERNFRAADLDVECIGKQYLITGSNSGIGKKTALEIARRGGVVHLVCRNPIAAKEARDEIAQESKNDNIFVHILDLSQPRKVHKFATTFAKENDVKGLHVLINNAGCMINKRTLTEEGIEKNFATNTLGTYMLTESLMPLILKTVSPDCRPRVITVSSGGMLTNKLNPNDLQTENGVFDGTMVYAQNKRQQIVIVEKWATKYKEVQFTTMHPGWVDTPAVRNSMPEFYNWMKEKLRTVGQGADTVVWLAVTDHADATKPEHSGMFYQDRCVVSKHLPLAWSRSSDAERNMFMDKLDKMYRKFSATT